MIDVVILTKFGTAPIALALLCLVLSLNVGGGMRASRLALLGATATLVNASLVTVISRPTRSSLLRVVGILSIETRKTLSLFVAVRRVIKSAEFRIFLSVFANVISSPLAVARSAQRAQAVFVSFVQAKEFWRTRKFLLALDTAFESVHTCILQRISRRERVGWLSLSVGG